MDEGIGVSNASVSDSWLVTELHPRTGLNIAIVTHGTNVSIGLAGGSAKVLSLTKLPAGNDGSLVLLGFTGTVAFDPSSATVIVSDAQLEAGTTVSAFIYGLPGGSSARAVSVDGNDFPFRTLAGGIIAFNVSATGDYFPVNGQLGSGNDPFSSHSCSSRALRSSSTTTSSYCTTFSIPSAVNAQIAARKQTYPVRIPTLSFGCAWICHLRRL